MTGARWVRLHQSLHISITSIDQTDAQLHVSHLKFKETVNQEGHTHLSWMSLKVTDRVAIPVVLS